MTALEIAVPPETAPHRRRRVLLLTDWYIPAYKAGGPIRSVANLVEALASEIEFSIIAGDRDLGDTAPLPGIEPGRWCERNGYRVCYVGRDLAGLRVVRRAIASDDYDVVHVNGLFSVLFTMVPLALRRVGATRSKVVVAPRGMLGAGALRIKHRKKAAYLAAARLAGLFRGVTWHATGATEVDEIRAIIGPGAPIELAPNLPNRAPSAMLEREKVPGAARFCFFSRISPKKGLLEGIRLLRAVPPEARASLDILGPIDDHAYWERCQAEIAALPANVGVEYRGAIRPDDVHATLARYHFLLLPTWNENYGHAIVDALAAGCPVLISDQTPWARIGPAGAGWTLALADTAGFEARIRDCVAMTGAEYARRSRNAAELAAAIRSDPDVLERSRALFA